MNTRPLSSIENMTDSATVLGEAGNDELFLTGSMDSELAVKTEPGNKNFSHIHSSLKGNEYKLEQGNDIEC